MNSTSSTAAAAAAGAGEYSEVEYATILHNYLETMSASSRNTIRIVVEELKRKGSSHERLVQTLNIHPTRFLRPPWDGAEAAVARAQTEKAEYEARKRARDEAAAAAEKNKKNKSDAIDDAAGDVIEVKSGTNSPELTTAASADARLRKESISEAVDMELDEDPAPVVVVAAPSNLRSDEKQSSNHDSQVTHPPKPTPEELAANISKAHSEYTQAQKVLEARNLVAARLEVELSKARKEMAIQGKLVQELRHKYELAKRAADNKGRKGGGHAASDGAAGTFVAGDKAPLVVPKLGIAQVGTTQNASVGIQNVYIGTLNAKAAQGEQPSATSDMAVDDVQSKKRKEESVVSSDEAKRQKLAGGHISEDPSSKFNQSSMTAAPAAVSQQTDPIAQVGNTGLATKPATVVTVAPSTAAKSAAVPVRVVPAKTAEPAVPTPPKPPFTSPIPVIPAPKAPPSSDVSSPASHVGASAKLGSAGSGLASPKLGMAVGDDTVSSTTTSAPITIPAGFLSLKKKIAAQKNGATGAGVGAQAASAPESTTFNVTVGQKNGGDVAQSDGAKLQQQSLVTDPLKEVPSPPKPPVLNESEPVVQIVEKAPTSPRKPVIQIVERPPVGPIENVLEIVERPAGAIVENVVQIVERPPPPENVVQIVERSPGASPTNNVQIFKKSPTTKTAATGVSIEIVEKRAVDASSGKQQSSGRASPTKAVPASAASAAAGQDAKTEALRQQMDNLKKQGATILDRLQEFERRMSGESLRQHPNQEEKNAVDHMLEDDDEELENVPATRQMSSQPADKDKNGQGADRGASMNGEKTKPLAPATQPTVVNSLSSSLPASKPRQRPPAPSVEESVELLNALRVKIKDEPRRPIASISVRSSAAAGKPPTNSGSGVSGAAAVVNSNASSVTSSPPKPQSAQTLRWPPVPPLAKSPTSDVSKPGGQAQTLNGTLQEPVKPSSTAGGATSSSPPKKQNEGGTMVVFDEASKRQHQTPLPPPQQPKPQIHLPPDLKVDEEVLARARILASLGSSTSSSSSKAPSAQLSTSTAMVHSVMPPAPTLPPPIPNDALSSAMAMAPPALASMLAQFQLMQQQQAIAMQQQLAAQTQQMMQALLAAASSSGAGMAGSQGDGGWNPGGGVGQWNAGSGAGGGGGSLGAGEFYQRMNGSGPPSGQQHGRGGYSGGYGTW